MDCTREELRRFLHDRGINLDLCYTHPVELDRDGCVAYVKRVRIGTITKMQHFIIGHAKTQRDRLVGFLYEGPTLRTDSDMLARLTTGGIEIPAFVIMYHENVPMAYRTGLASGENRIRERPMVTLDTRISQRAG